MSYIDGWFLLWGIVVGFFIQVLYDRMGEANNRKFFGGLLIAEGLTVVVVLMAYPLGLFNALGMTDAVLTWVALLAVIVITVVLFLATINKIDLTKYRKQRLKK